MVDPRKPVQCFGRQASAEAHKLLDGHRVRLTYGSSQGRVDKYGRTLAYVWLPDGRLFEERMIRGGWAHEYTYDSAYRYMARLRAAETHARINEKGLWSPSTCDGNTDQAANPAASPSTTPTATPPRHATPRIGRRHPPARPRPRTSTRRSHPERSAPPATPDPRAYPRRARRMCAARTRTAGSDGAVPHNRWLARIGSG